MSNAEPGGSSGESIWNYTGIDKDTFYAAALYLSKTAQHLPVRARPSNRVPKTPERTREFLDCLADCFARAKDQTARDHVSATAMVRDDEAKTITLYIAKNQIQSEVIIPTGQEDLSRNANKNENEKFVAELVSWFTALANGSRGTHTHMFKTMCIFSANRLEFYIGKIRRFNYLEIARDPRNDREARNGWKSAKAVIEKCKQYRGRRSDLESCVKLAGKTRENEKFCALTFWDGISLPISKSSHVTAAAQWINYLGRLWAAYELYAEFCSHKDQKGFTFDFKLLPSEEEEWLQDRYLEEIRSWPAAVKAAADGRLQKLLDAKDERATGAMARVHCEIQLMNYFAQRPDEKCLDYFGCSKLSCWLCWHLMLHNDRFTVGGIHLRLYELWAIPFSFNPFNPSHRGIAAGPRDCYDRMQKFIEAKTVRNSHHLRVDSRPMQSCVRIRRPANRNRNRGRNLRRSQSSVGMPRYPR